MLLSDVISRQWNKGLAVSAVLYTCSEVTMLFILTEHTTAKYNLTLFKNLYMHLMIFIFIT